MPNIPFTMSIFKAVEITPTGNGIIAIPDEVLAIDLAALDQYKDLPIIKQWKDKYGFYYLPLKVGIKKTGEKLRGVKRLKFHIEFPSPVIIEDHGPKTEWVKKDIKIVIAPDLKFTVASVVEISNPFKVEWAWEPKVGKVISSSAGQDTAIFEFNKVYCEYLDGDRNLSFIFRAPKGESSFNLAISNIEISYDISFKSDVEEKISKEYSARVLLPTS